jgi:hypothetical protein
MNCPNCGSAAAAGSFTCQQCGAPLAQQQGQQQGHPGPQLQQQAFPPQGAYPPPQQPYGYPPGVQPGMPQRTSGMAIAGFVLSFFCALLGLIFSAVAMGEINRSGGTVGGKGLAIAGLVISIVNMILGFAIAFGGA